MFGVSGRYPGMIHLGILIMGIICFIYLGCIITNTMDDTLDISKQMRSIYARSNMLNVKFGCCTKIVKSLISVILYKPVLFSSLVELSA